MAGKPQYNWPDSETFIAQVKIHGTPTAAAREMGLPNGWYDWYKRTPNLRSLCESLKGAAASEMSSFEVDGRIGDIKSLVERRGLEIEDWELSGIRLNEYGKCGECGHGGLEQNRVDLRPRRDFLVPVRADGWKAPRTGKVTPSKGRIGLLPDQHAPHFDPALHVALCEWIVEAKPEKLVLLGDLLDNPSISRHPKNGKEISVKECMESGYSLLRDYAQAIEKAGMAVGPEGCEIIWIVGNHDDDRLSGALHRAHLSEIANLSRVGEEEPALRFEYLMRLDELNVRAVRPPEGYSYKHAELPLTDNLLAVHGWYAKPKSGSSAMATLNAVGENVVQGHSHRQSIVFSTKWHRGREQRLAACEAGTLASIEQNALNYAHRPDWQGGWAVAETYDGCVSFDLATAVNNQVLWRGNSFST